MSNPIEPFLTGHGRFLLDGGLATELERRGCDLRDPLWSARMLLDNPDAISAVHRDFLEAGADCIATATYQASYQGFAKRGLNGRQADDLFGRAVRLAVDARDDAVTAEPGRRRPLVAASIGPYGAYLADGSEYSGAYGLTTDQLVDFHRPRWNTLAHSGADLVACETFPSALEIRAVARLMAETPETWAWVSLCCRDSEVIHDGTTVEDALAPLADMPNLAAVGVNCTPPQYIDPLIKRLGGAVAVPILVYPNSGEQYDARTKTWQPAEARWDLAQAGPRWLALGASGVGGCCRIGAADIRRLHDACESGSG